MKSYISRIALILLSLSGFFTLKGVDELYKGRLGYSNLYNGLVVSDDLYEDLTVMNPNSIAMNSYQHAVRSRVLLRFDERAAQSSLMPYTIEVRALIKREVGSYNRYGALVFSTHSEERTLKIEYRPGEDAFKDVDVVEYLGGNKISVEVLSVISHPYQAAAPVSLEAEVEVERYYWFNGALPMSIDYQDVTPVQNSSQDYVLPDGKLHLYWSEIEGAEQYDLEWVYVNNYHESGGILFADQVQVPARLFDFNSTRVSLSESHYDVPYIYGKGYLLYRVRAVGYDWDAPAKEIRRIEGAWTTDLKTAGTVNDYPDRFPSRGESFVVHNEDLNYQYTTTFAEEGKRKTVIGYYDGTSRNRQNITHVNSSPGVVVVGETKYDYQGRAALEVLPTPELANRLDYLPNRTLAQTTGGTPNYGVAHFDEDASDDNCAIGISPMSTSKGASRYYSDQNEFYGQSGEDENDFIPKAHGYPFSQIEYMPDNTGRIKRQGGVGLNHQLNTGHEALYFYETPFQEELDRLFGSDVGDALHYKKNTVRDANSQLSVTYLDPQGRTIATGLTGTAPSSMIGLGGSISPLEVDLLGKKSAADNVGSLNRIDYERGTRTVSRQIGVPAKQSRDFYYRMDGMSFMESCTLDVQVYDDLGNMSIEERSSEKCYDCVLDLTVSLKDECGAEHLSGVGGSTDIHFTVGDEVLTAIRGGTVPSCSDQALPSIQYPQGGIDDPNGQWTATDLEPGSYSLFKELKVNEEALKAYTEDYLSSSACMSSESDFIGYELAQMDLSGCYITCDECSTKVAGLSQFVSGNCDADPTAEICLTQAQYDEMLAQCASMCDDQSERCEVAYRSMLSDMSPHGQYGRIGRAGMIVNGVVKDVETEDKTDTKIEEGANPADFPLSIFNELNSLPASAAPDRKSRITNTRANWRHPYHPDLGGSLYYDEYGDPAWVYIRLLDENKNQDAGKYNFDVQANAIVFEVSKEDGIYRVAPHALKHLKDFLRFWDDSWAQSLIVYHPEYSLLSYCRQTQSSQNFDYTWNSLESFAEAVQEYPNKKYLSPENEDPFFSSTVTVNANGTDVDVSLSGLKPIMTQAMDHFRKDGQGTWISMEEYAYQLAVCPNGDFTGTQPGCSYTKGSGFNTGQTDADIAQGDLQWQIFRGFYSSLKQRLYEVIQKRYSIVSRCYNGCFGAEDYNTFWDDFSLLRQDGSYAILNPYQPCGVLTSSLYKEKMARFPLYDQLMGNGDMEAYMCYDQTPLADVNMEEDYIENGEQYEFQIIPCEEFELQQMEESRDIVTHVIDRDCGKTPNSFLLGQLIGNLYKDLDGTTQRDIYQSNVSLSNYPLNSREGFNKILENGMFGEITGSVNWSYDAVASNGTTLVGYFEATIDGQLQRCTLTIEIPSEDLYLQKLIEKGESWESHDGEARLDISQLTWSEIADFGCLRPKEGGSLGDFELTAQRQIEVVINDQTGETITVSHGYTLEGNISCLNLKSKDIDWEDIVTGGGGGGSDDNPDDPHEDDCEENDIATDLVNLLNGLVVDYGSGKAIGNWTTINLRDEPYNSLISYDLFRLFETTIGKTGECEDWQIYFTQSDATTLNIHIGNSGETSNCKITLKWQDGDPLSGSYSFADIIGLFDLEACYNNDSKQFTIRVKLDNGTTQGVALLEGSVDCWSLSGHGYGVYLDRFTGGDGVSNWKYYDNEAGSDQWMIGGGLNDGRYDEFWDNECYLTSFGQDLESYLESWYSHPFQSGCEKKYGEMLTWTSDQVNIGSHSNCGIRMEMLASMGLTFSNVKRIHSVRPDYNYISEDLTTMRFIAFAEVEWQEGGVTQSALVEIKGTTNCSEPIGECPCEEDHFQTVYEQSFPTSYVNSVTICGAPCDACTTGLTNLFEFYDFTSDYAYQYDMLNACSGGWSSSEGTFRVGPQQIVQDGDNIDGTGSERIFDIGDHTEPHSLYGNFLIVDGHVGDPYPSEKAVYRKRFENLELNTNYEFTFWVARLNRKCRPHVDIGKMVNGSFVSMHGANGGVIQLDGEERPNKWSDNEYGITIGGEWNSQAPYEPKWEKLTLSFTTGTNPSVDTEIELAIVSRSRPELDFGPYYYAVNTDSDPNNDVYKPDYCGNEFGIDDIRLAKEVCSLPSLPAPPPASPGVAEYNADPVVGIHQGMLNLKWINSLCHFVYYEYSTNTDEEDCIRQQVELATVHGRSKHQDYVSEISQSFREDYIRQCLDVQESFLMNMEDSEQHFTLYYYDQAGSLVRTVPPKGVVKVTDANDLLQIKEDRLTGEKNYFTEHSYETTYKYNSLGQLVSQSTLDVDDQEIWNVADRSTGIPSNYNLLSSAFSDELTGIAFVEDDQNEGHILRTSDGGKTWVEITAIGLANLNDVVSGRNGTHIHSYAFGDHGLVLHRERLIDDQNGTDYDWVEATPPTLEKIIKARSLSSTELVVLTDKGNMFRTIDGAENWEVHSSSLSDLMGSRRSLKDVDIHRQDENVWVAISSGNHVYRSMDNGKTWIEVTSSGIRPHALNDVQWLGDNTLLGIGYDGMLLKSGLGSKLVWKEVVTPLDEELKSIHAINSGEGLILEKDGDLKYVRNQWQQVELLTGMSNVAEIDFVDSQTGYAVSTSGKVYKSMDGGKSWSLQTDMGLSDAVITMNFTDFSNGAIVSSGNDLYISYNGGSSWTQVDRTNLSDPITHAYSISNRVIAKSLYGTVWYTQDASSTTPTWVKLSDGGVELDQVRVVDFEKGGKGVIACDDGRIYISEDQGVSWVKATGTASLGAGNGILGMRISDDLSVMMLYGGQGEILYSLDQGATNWSRPYEGYQTPEWLGVSLMNGEADYQGLHIVGVDGTHLIYHDQKWTMGYTGTSSDLTDAIFEEEYKGWIVGTEGYASEYTGAYISRSSGLSGDLESLEQIGTTKYGLGADGKTYRYNSSNQQWESSNFTGINRVLALVEEHGGDLTAVGESGKVLHSENGGMLWHLQNKVTPPAMKDVAMYDSQVGYAVGENGAIFHTSDGGLSWSDLNLGINTVHFEAIALMGKDDAMLVGRNTSGNDNPGNILRLKDGNLNGCVGTIAHVGYHDVAMYGSYGVAVGDNGTILISNDYGASWNTASQSVVSTDLYGVTIVDPKWTVAVGANAQVVISKDQGQNWSAGISSAEQSLINNSTLRDVHFRDYKTGYIIGDNGSMMKTTNGGDSWEKEDVGHGHDLNHIASLDDYNHVIVGDNGSVSTLEDQTDLWGTRFWYDDLGRMVASQNSKQFNLGRQISTMHFYTYTMYDDLGRIVEVGQVSSSQDLDELLVNGKVSESAFRSYVESNNRSEITRTRYDESSDQVENLDQQNLRTRVSSSEYYFNHTNPKPSHGTYYSYDIHGNVKTLVQKDNFGNLESRMNYEYDLISGNVNRLDYHSDLGDDMYYRYHYDADNRLESAESSTNGVVWDEDARYHYYKHGPLARVELGDEQVQGVDYAYTLQGWTKSVNGNSLSRDKDMGQDGKSLGRHAHFGEDQYGYSLSYFDGDYQSVGRGDFLAGQSGTYFGNGSNDLYNGNIKNMVTSLRPLLDQGKGVLGMAYAYDQLNRLKSATAHFDSNIESGGNWSTGSTETTDYKVEYSYDANGNILTLKRNGLGSMNGGNPRMDEFTYRYENVAEGFTRNTNRLRAVQDIYDQSPASYDDLKHGQVFDDDGDANDQNNYAYDELGNLTRDVQEGINSITWNLSGKVETVYKTGSSDDQELQFRYDGLGNRISKRVVHNDGTYTITYYMRDASGNVISTYQEHQDGQTTSYSLQENTLYGSSRLGVINRSEVLKEVGPNSPPDITPQFKFSWEKERKRGRRQYELNNHLGNVLATVSDRKAGGESSLDLGNYTTNWVAGAGSTVNGDNTQANVTMGPGAENVHHQISGLTVGDQYRYHFDITSGFQQLTVAVFQDNPGGVDYATTTMTISEPGSYDIGFDVEHGDVYVAFSRFDIDQVSYVYDVSNISFSSVDGGSEVVALSAQDYYPFGMEMPGRSVKSDYRYGFNGMERDDEMKGEGNSYDFGARLYDSRTGRWLAVDPAKDLFPSESPYMFAGNNPIYFIDEEGKWKVSFRDANDHSKGIVFVAEPGDNLETLATQMGVPYDKLVNENFGGNDFTLKTPLKGGEWLRQEDLPGVEVFQNINNYLKEDRDNLKDNCASFCMFAQGDGEEWIDPDVMDDKLRESFKNLESIEDAKIGDVVTFHERFEFFKHKWAQGIEDQKIDAKKYYDENFKGVGAHYSIVLLKDKTGQSIEWTIQKSGKSPIEVSGYPGQAPVNVGEMIIIFEPAAINEEDQTPIYRNTETEAKK